MITRLPLAARHYDGDSTAMRYRRANNLALTLFIDASVTAKSFCSEFSNAEKMRMCDAKRRYGGFRDLPLVTSISGSHHFAGSGLTEYRHFMPNTSNAAAAFAFPRRALVHGHCRQGARRRFVYEHLRFLAAMR